MRIVSHVLARKIERWPRHGKFIIAIWNRVNNALIRYRPIHHVVELVKPLIDKLKYFKKQKKESLEHAN
jgi:hypothetical protein